MDLERQRGHEPPGVNGIQFVGPQVLQTVLWGFHMHRGLAKDISMGMGVAISEKADLGDHGGLLSPIEAEYKSQGRAQELSF